MLATATAQELIANILKAVSIAEILDLKNYTVEFKNTVKLIHPDVCNHPDAAKATAKLNALLDHYEKGTPGRDEVAEFTTNGYEAVYKVTMDNIMMMQWSIDNYKHLAHDGKVKTPHILGYMPKEMIFGSIVSDNHLTVIFHKRSIPISKLTLPQEHVNWILSRLLEYSLMLNQLGYVHCGLNPESIFITPENHGIQVMNYYHLTKVNGTVGTVNGNYKDWYPAELFTTKLATATIDLRLAKKIAAYLLGDLSGSGVRLRKDHNEAWVNFILQRDTDPVACYDNYRRVLKDNFESKFHLLNI